MVQVESTQFVAGVFGYRLIVIALQPCGGDGLGFRRQLLVGQQECSSDAARSFG